MLTCNGKPSAVISLQEFAETSRHHILTDCRHFDDYYFCHLDGAIHVYIDSAPSSATEPEHDPAKGGRNPLPKIEKWEKQKRGGSGMTACRTLLALCQAGLEGANLYIGSFSEWCRN